MWEQNSVHNFHTNTIFFSSSSWSSVAFFHKRYKIPFDNCTNSTFFLHFFFGKQQVKYLLSSRAFWRKKCLLLEINGDVLSSKRKNDLLYCFYFWFKKVIRNHRIFDFGHCYQALECFRNFSFFREINFSFMVVKYFKRVEY